MVLVESDGELLCDLRSGDEGCRKTWDMKGRW